MVVQHNLQAMNANRMLGITTDSVASSTEKLSSGYRINRAADDAAGLAISEKMRKQIRGLDQASSNAEDGISCVQTAEGALAEVQDMLQRMNELCVQAANGTNSETDRQYIQDELDQLVTEIDRVSETTKFNEIYLLKGDADNNGYYNMYVANYNAAQTPNVTSDTDQPTGKYNYVGTKNLYIVENGIATSTSYSPITADIIGTDDDITPYLNNTASGIHTDYTAFQRTEYSSGNATKTDGEYIANNEFYLYDTENNKVIRIQTGDNVTSYLDDTGTALSDEYVQLTNYTFSTDDIEEDISYRPLYDADGNEVSEMKLRDYFDEKGNYKGGLFYSSQATAASEVFADDDSSAAEDEQKISYYVTLNAEKVANELSFDLHVGADSDDENKITTSIVCLSSAGIGVNLIASSRIGIVDDTGALATDAIDVVADALQMVSTQRSALGAVQNRLEHTIKNLDNIVENTTSAESAIRDTDMAEEMVTYSNNNVLQQAGQAMLAQANQANQGILSLLQ